MKNITIIGGGVLETQIAYCWFDTTIWLSSRESINRTKTKLEKVKQSYIDSIEIMSNENLLDDWCNGIANYNTFDKEKCLKRVEKEYEKFRVIQDQKYISSMDEFYSKYLNENSDNE